MIWQDFMFACSMYPSDNRSLSSVRQEVIHQVKKAFLKEIRAKNIHFRTLGVLTTIFIHSFQVQRLQHHASIAIWAGNNENEAALVQNWYDTNDNYEQYKSDYIALYVDTIMPAVEEVDTTRTYLVNAINLFVVLHA